MALFDAKYGQKSLFHILSPLPVEGGLRGLWESAAAAFSWQKFNATVIFQWWWVGS